MLNNIITRYKNSSLAKRFAGGTFWSFLAGTTYNLAFLILGFILTHILGKYYYGQYGMVRSTINMFIVFSSFALGTTATKYVAQYRFSDKLKAERIINLSLIVSVFFAIAVFIICLCSSKYLAVKTLNTVELIPALNIGAFMILFLTVSSVINGVLIGFEEFYLIFKQNIIAVIFLLIFSSLGGYYLKVNGALAGLLIYLFVSLCLGIYYLFKVYKRENLHFTFKNTKQEIKVLWQFSLPTMLGGIVCTPIVWVANTILVNSNAGYGAMAGLDIIKQWYSAVLFIPVIASRVVLPMLSNLSDNTNKNSYYKVLKYSFLVNVGSAFLIGVILFLASKYLLMAYGSNFIEFKNAFGIMMLVAVVYVANSIVGQIILSKNYAWWGFLFNALWAIVFIVFNIIFVKQNNMGVWGVSLAYLISYIFHTVVQSIFSWVILVKKKEK